MGRRFWEPVSLWMQRFRRWAHSSQCRISGSYGQATTRSPSGGYPKRVGSFKLLCLKWHTVCNEGMTEHCLFCGARATCPGARGVSLVFFATGFFPKKKKKKKKK